jgi:hypothetical protein
MFYPLDTMDGVGKEYYFMRNSPHLISSSCTRLGYFFYTANHRDAISRNPKKYRIIKIFFNNFWLKKSFNIDMPMCSTAADYSPVPPSLAEEKKVSTWFLLIWKLYRTPPQIPEIGRFSLLERVFRALYALFEVSRQLFLEGLFKDFSYLKRS